MKAATTRQNTKVALPPFSKPRKGEACRQSWQSETEERVSAATLHPAPRTAELVVRDDTGRFYLRAFTNGRYLWQLVANPAAAIADTGIWISGVEFYHAYWFNHGAYRRRAGWYYPVLKPASVTRAA